MKTIKNSKTEKILSEIKDFNFDKRQIERKIRDCELELENEKKKTLIKLGWKKEVDQLDNILKERGFDIERDLSLFYPKAGEKVLLSESEIKTLVESVRMWEKKNWLELVLA